MGIVGKIWWRFMPGVIVTVRWPSGEIVVTEDSPLWDWSIGPSRYKIESADPNDHYRPWLEKHVGRQGIDWQWEPSFSTKNSMAYDTIDIKLRWGKEKFATYIAMQWS